MEVRRWYPTTEEIDTWCAAVLDRAECVGVTGEFLEDSLIQPAFGSGPNTLVNRYVRFTALDGRRPFYGY